MTKLSSLPVFLFLALSLHAETLYTFRPHEQRPGERVRLTATTTTKGGKMTVQRGDNTDQGKMSMSRERVLVRELVGTGRGQQLVYRIVKDVSRSAVRLEKIADGAEIKSPLSGHTVLGFRDDLKRWRLYLKGRTASGGQAVALAELEAYENRRLFPDGPVKVGDTWPIESVFIRHLTERDIAPGELKATATLKEVITLDNEKTAVIKLMIVSAASKANADAGTSAGAQFALIGTLYISLDTMLDKKLVLNGTLTTQARDGVSSTVAKLPFETELVKTVIK